MNRAKKVVDNFHELYYPVCGRNNWLGYQVLKCPFDLMAYQQLIYLTRPDFIIETGTYAGGSALFMANVCDAIDHGIVISIDLTDHRSLLPKHKRIEWLVGNSISQGMLSDVDSIVKGLHGGMVVLDSDHRTAHVLNEMNLYKRFVAPGCYMVVEDTNIGGRPVVPECKFGPWQAVQAFMHADKDFEIDKGFEENLVLTFNPGGYLKRKGTRPAVEFTNVKHYI